MWKHVCYSASISSLIIGLSIGCASVLPQPTTADGQWASQQWADTSTDDLAEGRAMYVRKCSGCHTLYDPKQYDAVTWTKTVDDMAPQAGIDADQANLILKYLLTSRRHADVPVKPSGTQGQPTAPSL